MADSQTVETVNTPAPKADDPYDLGDTELSFQEPTATPPTAPETAERPRNPDGTFAAFQHHVDPPAAPVLQHPAYLVEAARDFGLSDEDIADMPTPKLHKIMWNAQQRMQRVRAEESVQRTVQEGQVRTPEPEPTPEPEYDLGLANEAEFDPALIGALKRVAKSKDQEIKDLRSQLDGVQKGQAQRDNLRAAAIYDAAFASLGERYKVLFGTGSGRDMAQEQSPEFKRRIAVLNMAQANPANLTPKQVAAKIREAADLLYAPVLSAPIPAEDPYAEVNLNGIAKPRITPDQWEEAALSRPTQKRSDELPKGEKRAVQNLTQKLKDAGEVISDAEELDGFLE